jgi:hypothetical protein
MCESFLPAASASVALEPCARTSASAYTAADAGTTLAGSGVLALLLEPHPATASAAAARLDARRRARDGRGTAAARNGEQILSRGSAGSSSGGAGAV